MSGAVGALLCCCTEPEVCGSCFLRYRILWTGSIELLATCCPVIYCPDADTQAGQFTNKCDPCEWIINYGGNPCQGDCGRDGCYVATYDGQIGPLAIEIAAGGMAPPCIYQGIDTGGFEIMACCPPDPALPFCSSGQVGDISWSVSVQMMRGGFGLPPEDWVVQLRVIIATGPNSCYGDSVHEAAFHAPNSGNLCPHEASFIPISYATSGFEASQLDPCNRVLSYCLFPNVHAADIGTVQAIPA